MATIALGMACAGSLAAGDGLGGCWIARGVGAAVAGGAELAESGPQRSALALGEGLGLGVEVEHRRRCRTGIELALLRAELETSLVLSRVDPPFFDRVEGDAGLGVLTVGTNFHLTPESYADLFVGAFVGFADLEDVSFRPRNRLGGLRPGPGRRKGIDAGVAWGVRAGIDLSFGRDSAWAVHLGARYMDLSVDVAGDSRGKLEADPTIVTIGLSYRFKGSSCCEREPVACEAAPEASFSAVRQSARVPNGLCDPGGR